MFPRPEPSIPRGLTLARWATLGALFAIPFLPLVVERALYFPFVVGRNFAFRMLVEVATAGGLLLALADRRYRPRFSWTLAFLGLFVIWMGVADAIAVNPHKAFWGNLERMEGWVTLAHLFSFVLLAGSVLGAEGLWKRWWLTFVGVSGLVCAYGLAQLAHLARVNGIPTRIDANFGNAEFLAGYLLFAIAVTLWIAAEVREGRWRRYGLLGLAAVQVLVLLSSGTRGAAVGLVAAICFGAVLWLLQAGKPARRVAARVLILPAILICALPWALAQARNPLVARFAHMGAGDLQVRFSLWRMAWKGFLSRPVFGWGQEGFPYVFSRFYDPALIGQQPWFDRAHNLYLDWLVAGGAPALLLFLAAVASAALALYRGPFSQAGRIVLLAGLVAYGVQGLVVFDNLMTYAPLCAVLALAHSVRSTPLPALDRLPEMNPRRVTIMAAPIAVSALGVMLWWVNVPTLRSAHDLMTVLHPPRGAPVRLGYFKAAIDDHGFATQEIREKMGQFALVVVASPGGPREAKTGFAMFAADQMARELAHAPHEVRLRLQLAQLRRALGDAGGANQEIMTGLEDAPLNPLLLQERSALNAGTLQP